MRPAWMLLALAVVLLAPAGAAAAPDGPMANQCKQVDDHLVTPCYGADVLARDGQAHCKAVGACASDEPAIAGYERSWTHRALAFQESLSRDLPLRDAPWIGTHNSFNSIAEMGPTLSDADSNQQLSLTDQLAIDVRSLELDLHSFAGRQVVCHARGADEGHAGCSIERGIEQVTSEIGGWLRAHRDQVLLLYLEDHLDGAADHDAATAQLLAGLGNVVYRPSGAGCTKLPLSLTRRGVLDAGKQVVIVSGCGEGAAWPGIAFDWSDHVESGGPAGFRDYPDCGPDYKRPTYDANLVRYFEDSTWLSEGVAFAGGEDDDPGITPQIAAAMARCGVDLLGLDQLLGGDGRLDALVWSWARDEPRVGAGDCAVMRADG